MKEHSIVVKEKKVYYLHSGKGPNIVMLHGIPTHSELWYEMFKYLDASYSVYAFDLLGFGKSEKPESSEINIKYQSHFFQDVFKFLGLKDVILIGHDIGGGIAQIISVTNPGIVKAMVLIDSVCYDSWPIELLKVESKVRMLFEHLPHDVLRSLFIKYISDGMWNKDKVNSVADKYWCYIESKEGMKGFLNAVQSFDNAYTVEISGLLRQINIPTLIMWGKSDVYIRPSYGYRLSEDIKSSRIEIIQNAGHFLPEDQPETAAGLIDNFIKSMQI